MIFLTSMIILQNDFSFKTGIMKKFMLISAFFTFIVSSLTAQKTSFGLKAGYNSSSVKVKDGIDYDSKSGFHAGGLAHIHIDKHFAVQPELVFSLQGGERTNTTLRLNYLNIPVAFQYMAGEGFRLQTGPQLGFQLSAESKFGDGEVDVDDVYSTIDFSWLFGAGYIFPSGLGIDARFNLGISNISDESDFEARNRVFQLGLFYQFTNSLKKKK